MALLLPVLAMTAALWAGLAPTEMLRDPLMVAADSGGHREAIRNGETGFLVPPDDARAFAERISQLLARPDKLAAVAQRARADALDRFGSRRHVQAVIEVYEALLAAGQRPARANALLPAAGWVGALLLPAGL